jgi:hypothetical protein
MGQAKIRKAEIEQLKNTKITSAEEFYDTYERMLDQRVKKKYTLDEMAADLLLEDADVERKEDIQQILTGLFFWRHLFEVANMVEMSNRIDGVESELTPKNVMDYDYNFTKEMIEDGTYSSWSAALKEKVDMALTYRCWEPWDAICENYALNGGFKDLNLDKEVIGKVVAYLYDRYATEEEME